MFLRRLQAWWRSCCANRGGNGVEICLDKVSIDTKDFDEQLTLFDHDMHRLQSARVSVNFRKPRWCCSSLEYGGMIVDRLGVRPAEFKVQAV